MHEQSDTGTLTGATARLLERLGAAGVPVRLEHPANLGAPTGPFSEDPAGVVVWPVALLPETLPTHNGTPLRMRVRYLVCAGGSPAAALDLLDRVLAAEQPYLVPGEVPESLWQAIGARHRIGLLFDVPVNLVRPEQPVTRVTSLPAIVTASLRELTGKVVARGGVPLAGMRVAVADGTAATHTDAHGRFQLPGVVADQPVRLVVTGRGLRLAAEIPAGPAEPVVITCEI